MTNHWRRSHHPDPAWLLVFIGAGFGLVVSVVLAVQEVVR